MTLSDLSDSTIVSIEFVYLLKRLTQARKDNDCNSQEIINQAIKCLNNFPASEKIPFEPIMTVLEVKTLFPDYAVNPPPLRLFKITPTQLI